MSHIQQQWAVERPDLDTSPIGVIGRIHRIGNHLRREILANYREHGLGEGEFDILATLRRSGSPYRMLPTEISRHTMVTSGGVSKQLDRLEAAGLIQRITNDSDGRSRHVQLTATGLEVIDTAFDSHMANEARLLELLPEAERKQLEEVLSGWLARLEHNGFSV